MAIWFTFDAIPLETVLRAYKYMVHFFYAMQKQF